MAKIWSLENQYATWLKVELAVVKTQAQNGLIPDGPAKEILAKAAFDPQRILEIEAEVNHDDIAFVTSVEENVGPAARFFHYGLTSSDILDTSLALRLVEAADIIIEDLKNLLSALKVRAFEFKNTPIIGRSHGIHAEPTTFGLKLASFYAEFDRHLLALKIGRENLAVGQISGPVGNYSANSLSPKIEREALALLGLKPTPISTQIISRDIHAQFFSLLALLATSMEKLTVEIRLLARTEVGEVEEAFGRKQKGSSAMPHKKNPILSENISGLARVVRSFSLAALDNMVLWHERDISHSSVERLITPDATVLVDFMLSRLTSLVTNLVVKPEKMLQNLKMTGGLYNSQELLLNLCQKGLDRTQAYRIVQKQALAAASGLGDFKTLLLNDADLTAHLSKEEIEEAFKPDRFFRWTEEIFSRTFTDQS
jgi:adenylosuccinate lyase